ncbi:hypothetical protein Ahy_A03g016253 isoform D [Arachis hypogaea]|uniref:Uncharacterized protein n=1 Tax=Arachis hypogaea TaxID=3818 RepID=A0A445E2P3_ARAHY|nr:hypothetical protein Ahy_A03g016253 isoform D [Arachis hypogaea]
MEQESGKACLRNSYQLYVSNQSIQFTAAKTDYQDSIVLPTCPRQRTAEKLDRDRNRLGGGFRYYGGDHANRSSGGGDDSFNSVSTAVLVVLGLKERESGGADSDNWNKKKVEFNGGSERSEGVVGDLGLFCNLEGAGNGNGNVIKPKGPSPFGEVRPREEVLAEKGQDWKKIDEQLESMKIKEAAKKKESFRKRGFGSGNGRAATTTSVRGRVCERGPIRNTILTPLQNPDDKIESNNPHHIPNLIIIDKKEGEVLEVVSQLSKEPCSISGSFSTAATVTKKKEEEVTSKRSIREGTTTMMKNNKFPLRKRPHACDGNVTSGREQTVEEEWARVGIGE